MDGTFLAVAVAVVLVILLLATIFYYSSRETTFEEAYGRNALNLLSESDEQQKRHASAKGALAQKQKQKAHKKLPKAKNLDTKGAESSGLNDLEEHTSTEQPDQGLGKLQVDDYAVVGEIQEAQQMSVEITREKAVLEPVQKRQKQKTKQFEYEKAAVEQELINVKREAKFEGEKKGQNSTIKTDQYLDKPKSGNIQMDREKSGTSAGIEEEKLESKLIIESQKAAPSAAKKKKQKAKSGTIESKDEIMGEKSGQPTTAEPDVDLVIEQLKTTPLSEAYLSVIVECLLMRQNYASQNAKHAEEVQKLCKQMEEKEKTMNQNVQTINAAQQKDLLKFKELNQQLSNERAKYAALEKSARDQIQSKTAEADNAGRKLHVLTQDQHNLRETLRKTMETSNPQLVDQLRAELHNAKDRAVRVEAEVSQRQQQIAQMQKDIHNRDQQARVIQTEKRELEMRLQEMGKSVQQKTNDTKIAELLAAKESELCEAQNQLDGLKRDFLELESSALKIKAENEKNRARVLIVQNGGANDGPDNTTTTTGGQQQQQKQQQIEDMNDIKNKEKQIAQLTDELKKSETKIAEFGAKLDVQAMEADKMITDLMCKVESVQKEKDKLNERCQKQEDMKNKDLETALNAKNKLESEMKSLKVNIDEKLEANAGLECQLAEYRRELESAKKQNCDLESKGVEIAEKMTVLTEELDRLKSEKETLEQSEKPEKTAEPGDHTTVTVQIEWPCVDEVQIKREEDDDKEEGGSNRAENSQQMLSEKSGEKTAVPRNVLLTGSFWSWSRPRAMTRGITGYYYPVQLPIANLSGTGSTRGEPEIFEFKFVVDGVWRCSERYPKKTGPDGLENNILEIDLNKLQEINWKLTADIETLREQNFAKNEHGHRLARELQSKIAYIEKLEAEKSTNDGDQKMSAEVSKLTKELEDQRQKNDELRQKNYRVVEAVGKIEETSKLMVRDVENKYKQLMRDERGETVKILSAVLSREQSTVKTPIDAVQSEAAYGEWVREMAGIIKKESVEPKLQYEISSTSQTLPQKQQNLTTGYSAASAADSREIEELRSSVKNYKNVLLAVEKDLRELELNTEHQEKHWQHKYKLLEGQLAKAKSDASQAETGLKSQLNEEMNKQLVPLQSKCVQMESVKDSLKEQVTKLQQQLIDEQTTGKDLSAQAVKLRGMLKTGQDALLYEQNLVAELKGQLINLQASNNTENGQVTNTEYSMKEAQLLAELKSLKERLEQREKQLSGENQNGIWFFAAQKLSAFFPRMYSSRFEYTQYMAVIWIDLLIFEFEK